MEYVVQSLNTMAFTKMMKKHDKATGLHMKEPFLERLQREPFQTSTVIKDLMAATEVRIARRCVVVRICEPGSRAHAQRVQRDGVCCKVGLASAPGHTDTVMAANALVR